ncbi:helix-turn-helix domain-containing protein [Chryseobacterium viscerum]|uniref:Transposase n=1 Tax=Chryseobacterium viscerum TaxID=1037377 RepID=A0A316W9G1_9FLAO|nr:helix-turn-helix domain-containing protein [Chryseobacterium viscerum]PWN57945.1 transposase [Chryseobacterium viscerum]
MTKEIKEIHIGEILLRAVKERGIHEERICKFFGCSSSEVSEMYINRSINSELLLRWSKLLEYDFFRIYSQHLILYSPQAAMITKNKTYTTLPKFRKNIYSHEVIKLILEIINTGEKTIQQIVSEYGIPRATVYKWMNKHRSLIEQ